MHHFDIGHRAQEVFDLVRTLTGNQPRIPRIVVTQPARKISTGGRTETDDFSFGEFSVDIADPDPKTDNN